MRLCDEIGMYVTVVEMSTLSIVMIVVLVWAFKRKLYNFMKILLVLCILADLGTGLLSIGLALETDKTFHVNHVQPLATLIGWNTFLFNCPTNLLHWMFGYKYWVISVEVPLALSGEIRTKRSREHCYMALNITMIMINVTFCVWVSFARYHLSVESAGHPASIARVNEVSELYHVVTFLLLVSALFLADALRRIKKTFTTNPHLI